LGNATALCSGVVLARLAVGLTPALGHQSVLGRFNLFRMVTLKGTIAQFNDAVQRQSPYGLLG
jgi:hypothetical protein